MHRRGFVAGTLATGFGGVLRLRAQDNGGSGLSPGLQLFTIRRLMQDDVPSALALVADIGYRHVELAGYFGYPASELRLMLDDAGLTAPAAHVSPADMTENLDAAIESALILGHRYLVVPSLSVESRATLDGYYRVAEQFNAWGEACDRAGLLFAYHNHDFEFELADGQVPYDVLLDETDPALVEFELDLYWIRAGGRSELEYFERYPGRFTLWHVKDMDTQGGMIDVGDDVIDFAALFDRDDTGVRYAFVEHDNPPDPETTIRRSYAAIGADAESGVSAEWGAFSAPARIMTGTLPARPPARGYPEKP